MTIYQLSFWIFLCLIGFETISWEYFIYPSAASLSVNLLPAGEKEKLLLGFFSPFKLHCSLCIFAAHLPYLITKFGARKGTYYEQTYDREGSLLWGVFRVPGYFSIALRLFLTNSSLYCSMARTLSLPG